MFLIMCRKIIIEEIGDIFLGPLFLIMCFTNIKNIDVIYYPINWDNFHNKTNYILVENRPTREINLNFFFQKFQKNKLHSNVNFLN